MLLSVGLQLKVLDTSLFTMLVVMAIVTTIMTAPLLKIVYPDRIVKREVEEAERAALGIIDAYRVLVVVDDPGIDAPLVSLAADLAASEQPSQVVLTAFRPQTVAPLEIGSGLSIELAEMAGVMGQLEGLAEEVRARGVECVVLSRFSVDPTGDLIDQAQSTAADLILLSETADLDKERLLASVEITVALWEGAPALAHMPGAIAALAHSGEGADSAIALGVRISAVRGDLLQLIDDGSRRRVGGLVDRSAARRSHLRDRDGRSGDHRRRHARVGRAGPGGHPRIAARTSEPAGGPERARLAAGGRDHHSHPADRRHLSYPDHPKRRSATGFGHIRRQNQWRFVNA